MLVTSDVKSTYEDVVIGRGANFSKVVEQQTQNVGLISMKYIKTKIYIN